MAYICSWIDGWPLKRIDLVITAKRSVPSISIGSVAIFIEAVLPKCFTDLNNSLTIPVELV